MLRKHGKHNGGKYIDIHQSFREMDHPESRPLGPFLRFIEFYRFNAYDETAHDL